MRRGWRPLPPALVTLALAAALLPAASRTARGEYRDVHGFRQPHARCMRAAPGHILTAVGRFPVRGGALELVADTQLAPIPDVVGFADFGAPSVSAFDGACRRVWHQAFQDTMAEASFEVLTLPGGRKALLVMARSMFQPVDQLLLQGGLFLAGGGGLVPVGEENLLGGSKYRASYVGPLPGGGFGIVTAGYDDESADGRGKWTMVTGEIRHWRGEGFAAPAPLDVRGLVALHLPAETARPPFPLCRSVFGSERGSDPCAVPSPTVPAALSDTSTGTLR